MKITARITSVLLALLLLLTLAACATVERTGVWEDATYRKDKEFGEGEITVTVKVVAEEQSVTFTIHTDEKYLGDALLAHDLIAGDEGPYGLYVKTVNGIVADYDEDQSYWAFTKGGELMMVGIDGAEIADGESYELTRTK